MNERETYDDVVVVKSTARIHPEESRPSDDEGSHDEILRFSFA